MLIDIARHTISGTEDPVHVQMDLGENKVPPPIANHVLVKQEPQTDYETELNRIAAILAAQNQSREYDGHQSPTNSAAMNNNTPQVPKPPRTIAFSSGTQPKKSAMASATAKKIEPNSKKLNLAPSWKVAHKNSLSTTTMPSKANRNAIGMNASMNAVAESTSATETTTATTRGNARVKRFANIPTRFKAPIATSTSTPTNTNTEVTNTNNAINTPTNGIETSNPFDPLAETITDDMDADNFGSDSEKDLTELETIASGRKRQHTNSGRAATKAKRDRTIHVTSSDSEHDNNENVTAQQQRKTKANILQYVVTLPRDECSVLLDDITTNNSDLDLTVYPNRNNTRFVPKNEYTSKKIANIFNIKGVEYYYHSTSRQLKCVLSRCFQTDTTTIKEALTAAGRPPIAVRQIGKPEYAKYGIDFDASTTTMNDLTTNCRIMNYQVVRWELARNTKKGPTICSNCSMYGHTNSTCHRPPCCNYCNEIHNSTDCPSKEVPSLYRCINCLIQNLTGCHMATDPECPIRKLYLDTQAKRTATAAKKPKVNQPAKSNKFETRTTSWPPLNVRGTHTNANTTMQPTSPLVTFAEVVESKSPTHSRSRNRNMTRRSRGRSVSSEARRFDARDRSVDSETLEALNDQSPNNNNDIFSMAELCDIMCSAIDQLIAAPSKLHQMRICFGILSNACK